MKLLAKALIGLAGLWCPPCFADGGPDDCPIEQVAAQIRTVSGDKGAVFIVRRGKTLVAAAGACVLYSDEVRAGAGAQVTIEAPSGMQSLPRTVLGSGDGLFTWKAPPAQAGDRGISSELSDLWKRIAGSPMYATNAIGRGSTACPMRRPATQSRLEPLREVSSPEQRIGADLSTLMAAWRPLRWPGRVSASLRGTDGEVLAQGETCADSHVILALKAGTLEPGRPLRLEISDGPDSSFAYAITVTPSADFDPPPTPFSQNWMAGAWRMQSGSPDTHLDSLTRLSTAPPESFGAKRMVDWVLSNVKL